MIPLSPGWRHPQRSVAGGSTVERQRGADWTEQCAEAHRLAGCTVPPNSSGGGMLLCIKRAPGYSWWIWALTDRDAAVLPVLYKMNCICGLKQNTTCNLVVWLYDVLTRAIDSRVEDTIYARAHADEHGVPGLIRTWLGIMKIPESLL